MDLLHLVGGAAHLIHGPAQRTQLALDSADAGRSPGNPVRGRSAQAVDAQPRDPQQSREDERRPQSLGDVQTLQGPDHRAQEEVQEEGQHEGQEQLAGHVKRVEEGEEEEAGEHVGADGLRTGEQPKLVPRFGVAVGLLRVVFASSGVLPRPQDAHSFVQRKPSQVRLETPSLTTRYQVSGTPSCRLR